MNTPIVPEKENSYSLLRKYLEKAGIKRFWAKTGHTNFYKVEVEGENLIVQKTKKTGESGTSRKCIGEPINNGYEYLENYCKNNDGGAFFGCSDGDSEYPLKKYQLTTTQVVVEIDNIPTEEQKALYKWFSETSGLIPYLISSGGKSIHLHLLLDKPTEIEKVVYLRRLLVLLLDGDPAVTRPHQPYRLPCFYRREKEAYQEIIQEGDNYSLETILEGIKTAFKAKGYSFPEELPEIWWQHLQSILNSDKGNQERKIKPVGEEDQTEKVKDALEEGFTGWNKQYEAKRIEWEKVDFSGVQQDVQDVKEIIQGCLECIPPRVPKTGTYEEYRGLFCGIKNLLGENEAISLAQSHSPAEPKWIQIIRSSKGNYGIGTIIWLGQQYGYKLPQSAKKKLPPLPDNVVFAEFEDSRYSDEDFEKDLKQKESEEKAPEPCNEEKALNYILERYGKTGKLRFNLLTSEIEFQRGDDHLFQKIVKRGIRCPDDFYLELKIKAKIKISKQAAYDLMLQVAQMNAYHPVEDYLDSVKQTPTNIDVTKLSTTLLGTNNPLFDEYLYRHLLGSVARAVDPGVKKDECLVLIGEQGLNKSSFFEYLYGKDFFDDSVTGTDKDDLLICHRYWCLELGELDYLTGRKATGEIKNFLSRSADSFRAPYARTTKYYKRGFVFCGSVNTDSFLKDETGNRRFWVIPVDKHIDLRQVSEYRDQIWGEVYRRYLNGESIRLSSNFWIQQAEQVEQYREADPWETQVLEYVESLPKVRIPNILESALGLSVDKHTLREQRRVAGILKSHGWTQKRTESKRFWIPPTTKKNLVSGLVSSHSNPHTTTLASDGGDVTMTLGTNVLSSTEALSDKEDDIMTLDDTRFSKLTKKTTEEEKPFTETPPERTGFNGNYQKEKQEEKCKVTKNENSSVIVSCSDQKAYNHNSFGDDIRHDTRNDIKSVKRKNGAVKPAESNGCGDDTREQSQINSKSDPSVILDEEIKKIAEELNYNDEVLNSLSHDYFNVDDWRAISEDKKTQLKIELQFKVNCRKNV